jgi:quercetin dioxygenase-like cupin family protein
MDWHPAPRRQWLFVLSGTLEVEVQDGEVRQFQVGSIIFVEDTEGKGHKTRVVGKEAFVAAVVPVGTK